MQCERLLSSVTAGFFSYAALAGTVGMQLPDVNVQFQENIGVTIANQLDTVYEAPLALEVYGPQWAVDEFPQVALQFALQFMEKSEEMPVEFAKVLSDNFWDLL